MFSNKCIFRMTKWIVSSIIWCHQEVLVLLDLLMLVGMSIIDGKELYESFQKSSDTCTVQKIWQGCHSTKVAIPRKVAITWIICINIKLVQIDWHHSHNRESRLDEKMGLLKYLNLLKHREITIGFCCNTGIKLQQKGRTTSNKQFYNPKKQQTSRMRVECL